MVQNALKANLQEHTAIVEDLKNEHETIQQIGEEVLTHIVQNEV